MTRPRRLRVALVCPYSLTSPGGVQHHVLGLAAHLAAAGHQPYVLAPGEPGPATAGFPGLRYASSVGPAVPVRYNGSVARVSFGPRVAATVRRWLDAVRPDLVHVHEPITPSIALPALRAAEVPVVATFHTATPGSRSMRLAGAVLHATVGKIDAGIAVSEPARRVVLQHLGRDALVVPNGFERHTFSAGRPAPERSSGRRPRLVFLGRLDEPRKGLDVLLAALPLVRRRVPDLEVVVAGEGRRDLSGCTVLGPVDEATKAALLSGADVFVAPHRGRESFGIVLLEAMASGAPVVASALPAFRDLLHDRDGPLGDLVEPGDPAALAAAVVAALRDPDPARTARAQRAAAAYDWSCVGPRVIEVYRAALAARTGRLADPPWSSGAGPCCPPRLG